MEWSDSLFSESGLQFGRPLPFKHNDTRVVLTGSAKHGTHRPPLSSWRSTEPLCRIIIQQLHACLAPLIADWRPVIVTREQYSSAWNGGMVAGAFCIEAGMLMELLCSPTARQGTNAGYKTSRHDSSLARVALRGARMTDSYQWSPKDPELGTTIMAVQFQGGVVLAADSRT